MPDNTTPLQQWEYRRLEISNYGHGADNLINNAGEHGWELVACFPINADVGFYIFKRPKTTGG